VTGASLSHFVGTYGYLAVFGAVSLESLGVPIPGETTLVAAAAYAGATHRLSLVAVVIVATAAAVFGDNVGFFLGRSWGERLFLRFGRFFADRAKLESKLVVARYLFSRHGAKIVFLGRFVTVLRTYAAFLAGVSKMAWRRFLLSNSVGGSLWAVVFGVGGYEFGGIVTRVGNVMAIVLGVTATAAVAVAYLAMRRYGAEIHARALAATVDSH
jgi:membrane protein DedA with SNARE-associated domain